MHLYFPTLIWNVNAVKLLPCIFFFSDTVLPAVKHLMTLLWHCEDINITLKPGCVKNTGDTLLNSNIIVTTSRCWEFVIGCTVDKYIKNNYIIKLNKVVMLYIFNPSTKSEASKLGYLLWLAELGLALCSYQAGLLRTPTSWVLNS